MYITLIIIQNKHFSKCFSLYTVLIQYVMTQTIDCKSNEANKKVETCIETEKAKILLLQKLKQWSIQGIVWAQRVLRKKNW